MDLSAFPPKPTAKQIAAKFRSDIAEGLLKPGEKLPTARKLAAGLTVQLNTVQSAYGQLRDEGLVLSQQGRGTFVRDPAAPLGTEEGSSPAFAALAGELAAIHEALQQLDTRLDRLERHVGPGEEPADQ